jgi:hypothetical protein
MEIHFFRPLSPVGCFGHGKQLGHFRLQIGFNGQQPLVTDSLALGSVGMDFAPIQADVTQLQIAHRLSQQQYLDKQLFQFGQMLSPKVGDGIVVEMHVTGDESEWQHFVGRLFNLARTEHPRRIPVDQQSQQQFQGVGWRSFVAILLINAAQVKLAYNVYREPGQVVGRQDVT